ncbi:pentatricopeptide repeat-containing protein at3g46790 chloroplastic [Phtheirospermum japonicum]|uniref:Pentatricopeptide repeat-containing protein at3g46790 chloroplastic n=1 Tax=Phtheirospermum japonicum TaxID=374723 RepID=A0A830C4W6_9LAMI|nr:pentatricopeptide repeat-containing protein at3g46790 chloroplastic [Phtheirospermum japonicum]
MYSDLNSIHHARKVFDEITHRTIYVWNAIFRALSISGQGQDVLSLYRKMNKIGMPNDRFTYTYALKACVVSESELSSLCYGKQIHAHILRHGYETNVHIMTTLVDMYAKFGCVDISSLVFSSMPVKNLVSWSAMIACFSKNGRPFEALRLFHDMMLENENMLPNSVTMVSVLQACAAVSALEQGKLIHGYILRKGLDSILPVMSALGRANRVDEAARFIADMRDEPGPKVWGALLGSCRIHYNVELAERASNWLFELEPRNAGNYVLLADIYAEAKMWEEVKRVKKLLEARGLQKVSGCSWIEVNRKIYSLRSVDELNPQIEQIHALLVELSREMVEKGGYLPEAKVVLYDLDNEEKQRLVLGHSEKLAVAFGLINCGRGETIRISKNLRLCEDCHSFTKFVSKFVGREILVRDVNRFHCFRDGECSCRDYW